MYIVWMQGNNYLKNFLGIFTSRNKAVDTIRLWGARVYTKKDYMEDADKKIKRYREWPFTHGTVEQYEEFKRRNITRIEASKERIASTKTYVRFFTTNEFAQSLVNNNLQAYSGGLSFKEGIEIYIEKIPVNKIVNGFHDD